MRHGPANADIAIQAEENEGWVRIAVADHGPGIEPRHAERLFERFYRVSGESEGSGLGLAIVKHIALAHGGVVSLESTPGTGSVFTLLLPSAG